MQHTLAPCSKPIRIILKWMVAFFFFGKFQRIPSTFSHLSIHFTFYFIERTVWKKIRKTNFFHSTYRQSDRINKGKIQKKKTKIHPQKIAPNHRTGWKKNHWKVKLWYTYNFANTSNMAEQMKKGKIDKYLWEVLWLKWLCAVRSVILAVHYLNYSTHYGIRKVMANFCAVVVAHRTSTAHR